MTWQPIETAPIDGTWVLVVICGTHEDGYPYVPSVDQWVDGHWDIENYLETGKEWHPTHWMPLPELPKAEVVA